MDDVTNEGDGVFGASPSVTSTFILVLITAVTNSRYGGRQEDTIPDDHRAVQYSEPTMLNWCCRVAE